MNSRACRILLIAASIVTVAIGRVSAQTTGSISGVVHDPTTLALPDAKLQLRNVSTGAIRNNSTDAAGSYSFALVLPGTYELTVEKSGFSTLLIKDILVQVNSAVREDCALQLSGTTQQVTVTANPVAVNEETATLGEVINSSEITSLPLNGRDFLQLGTLTAGTYTPAPSSIAEALSGGRSGMTLSVSGSREVSSEFLLDGISSKLDVYGSLGVEPSVDAIAEFKIQEGYFSPQFGLPAVVNVVMKSGTNRFQGAAWEFLRNDVLDARNFFDTSRQPYRQNQFGADIGGPVLKDKLFFFGDYEGLRIRESFTQFARVPTAAELQGDFSGDPTIIDPSTGMPYSGNKIPSSEIVSFAQKFNQFIPAPNSTPVAALGGANFFGTRQHIQNDNKYDGRIDFTKSAKDTFFGRFSIYDSGEDDTSILPGQGESTPKYARNFVLAWTHVFGSNVVNSFRAGLDRAFQNVDTADDANSPNWANVVGLSNLNQIPACNAVPSVTLATYQIFGFSFGNCIIYGNTNKVFLDSLALVHGRHNITIGGQLTRENLRDIGAFNQNGSFQFTGQYTGNSAADYLIGSPFFVSGSAPQSPLYLLSWEPNVYANDDLHLTRNLTVNLGLRWEFVKPPIEKNNHAGYLDFQTGQILYAGQDGVSRGVLYPNYADFAPRFGFAYAPFDNWVIRGSYGIFWDAMPGGEKAWIGVGLPEFTASYAAVGGTTVSGINVSTLFPTVTPSPQGGPGSTIFILAGDRHRSDAYLQQWTLDMQHVLRGNTFLQAAYVGTRGTHLSTRLDPNQALTPPPPGDNTPLSQRIPFPHFGLILDNEASGNSYYHSLQLTARRQMSRGLAFLSAYTYSSSVATDGTWGSFLYRPNLLQRGRDPDNPRHRFVTSFNYNLPFGTHASGFARQAIGGWSANGILTLQSGFPFSVGTITDQSNTGVVLAPPEPNRTCNGNLSGGARSRLRWFDTNCFVLPPYDSFGNAGINYLYGPGTRNLDFAIFKSFPVYESQQLEFRAEFFNAFNFTNFGNPGATLGTPTFGVIGSAGPPREIQFGLKYLF